MKALLFLYFMSLLGMGKKSSLWRLECGPDQHLVAEGILSVSGVFQDYFDAIAGKGSNYDLDFINELRITRTIKIHSFLGPLAQITWLLQVVHKNQDDREKLRKICVEFAEKYSGKELKELIEGLDIQLLKQLA